MKKLLAILFFVSIGLADDGLKTILHRYQKQPVEIDYKLEVFWSVRERTNRRSGTALFTSEDKFYVKLGSYEWISNGDTVWQYSERREQVTVYSPERAPFEMPNRLFAFLLETPFTVKNLSEDLWYAAWESGDTVSSATYVGAQLHYDTKQKTVTRIILKDREGNIYTYEIKETSFHQTVPEKTFSFTIPAGVEIIEKM